MPIDGEILGLQRRDATLGEIRIGTSVEVTGKSYRKPVRLDTFRFTTSVELNAKAIAELYGGQVAPWSQRKGKWEVITNRTALDVWVPPAGLAVDTNMEMWNGPKRERQCDGRIERISGEPCTCPRPDDPHDPVSVRRALDERHRLAAMRPPQACKPLTRMNLTVPDLPGLTGTWRLNTGSENAAVETAGAGDAMVIAREGGVYLPAVLSIQWRYRADTGAPYPVPFLQIGMSMRDLAAGVLPAGPGGLLQQLHGSASDERRAIGAAAEDAPDGTPPDDTPAPPPPDEPGEPGGWTLPDRAAAATPDAYAQQLAYAAADAATRADVRKVAAAAKAAQAGELLVCVDDERDLFDKLRTHVTHRLNALPEDGA